MKKIMFNDQYGLTKAVLDGKKTQTRRMVKGKNDSNFIIDILEPERIVSLNNILGSDDNDLSSYHIGETVAIAQRYSDIMKDEYPTETVQNVRGTAGWNNKMFVKSEYMIHHICITDVHVERLQDISDTDCFAEGIYRRDDVLDSNLEEVVAYTFPNSLRNWLTPKEAYAALIDKISGKGTWDSNPYVFVYEFELID